MNEVSVDNALISRMLSGPLSDFLTTYKIAINCFLAFSIISCIVVLILNIVRFGAAAENPSKRHVAMTGLLVSGVCLGLLTVSGTIYVIILSLL